MIKYSLKCDKDHSFEAWFSDSLNFEKQNKKKLISCPSCSSLEITKNMEVVVSMTCLPMLHH